MPTTEHELRVTPCLAAELLSKPMLPGQLEALQGEINRVLKSTEE